MTKYAGLSIVCNIDNSAGSPVNISNDVNAHNTSIKIGEQDVTGLDKTAIERLQLLEDFEATVSGNGLASSTTRAVFETNTNARTLVIDFPDSATMTVEVMIFGYTLTRGADGGITWSTSLKLCNGTKVAWS